MIITLEESIIVGLLSIPFISFLSLPLGASVKQPWVINFLYQNPSDPKQKDEQECVKLATQNEANEYYECKIREGLPFDYNYGTFNLSHRQRKDGRMVTMLYRQASIKNDKDGNPHLSNFPIGSGLELD